MSPKQFFQQAQAENVIPNTAELQSSFQFGVEADELAKLVLTGQKTATTSQYVQGEDDLPGEKAYDVILDSQNQPVCIIQNDQVLVVNYLDVDEQHVFAEGEGDLTLASWRKVHDEFFTEECKSEGTTFNPATAQVALEKFHLVYPK